MKHNRLASFSAGLLILALAGCSGVPGTISDDANGEEPRTLVWGHSVDPRSMDPHDALQTSAERVSRNMHSRLFMRDENMEIVPELATEYENIDEETWQFTIREDAIFHNGDQLTSADVKYSLDRVINDETLLEYQFFNQISSVEATGDYEIEITTDGPMPTLIPLLAKSGSDILPSEYIKENGMDAFIESPIGAGPYEFESWQLNNRVVLTKNEDYWGEEPRWDEVEVRTIPENSTRVSELLTGGVDIIADVPPNDWDRVDQGDGTTMGIEDTTRVAILIVRMTDGYDTADQKIRDAVDFAIDQGAITDSLFNGEATPTRSRVVPGAFGANEDLYNDYVYEPEQAAEIVENYGKTPSITLTASRGTYPLDAEVAEMITQMLEDVGFDVDLEILEGGAFSDMYTEYTSEDLYMISLADGLMDASYPLVHYTQQRAEGQTDYHNEEVDELIAEGNRTLDDERRAEVYAKAQAIISEDRPHIPLYVQPGAYGISEDLTWKPRLDESIVFDDVIPNN